MYYTPCMYFAMAVEVKEAFQNRLAKSQQNITVFENYYWSHLTQFLALNKVLPSDILKNSQKSTKIPKAWISICNKEMRLFCSFSTINALFCSSNKRKTYLRVIGFPRDAFAQLSKFNLFHRVYSSNTKTAFPFLLFFQVFVMKVGQD